MIVQADIERCIGARRLIDCTDDDRDGVADAVEVARLIADASSIAQVELQKAGYPSPLPDELVTPFVRMQVAWIAAHLGARRRAEWHDDEGRALWWREFDDARKALSSLARRDIALEGNPPPRRAIVVSRPRRGW